MTLDELTRALDELAWVEHMNFEMGERQPEAVRAAGALARARLRDLAGRTTPSLLDALEARPGYAGWALRLSPNVPGDRPVERGRRFLDHPDHDVRHWAGEAVGDRRADPRTG